MTVALMWLAVFDYPARAELKISVHEPTRNRAVDNPWRKCSIMGWLTLTPSFHPDHVRGF